MSEEVTKKPELDRSWSAPTLTILETNLTAAGKSHWEHEESEQHEGPS